MASSRYTPTPEEIARACTDIRSSWTEREYRRRAGWSDPEQSFRWKPPEYSALELGLLETARVHLDH